MPRAREHVCVGPPRASISPSRGVGIALQLCLLAVPLVSCGAEGVSGPPFLLPDDPAAACLATRAATERTRAAIEAGTFQDLGPILGQVLLDEGGLRLALPFLRAFQAESPPGMLGDLAAGYGEGRGLARLREPLYAGLEYVVGAHPDLPGEHYEAIEAAATMLGRCDVIAMTDAMEAWRALRTKNASGELVSWWSELLDALQDLVADPGFQDLLGRIRFQDDASGADEGGTLSLGREAFIVIAGLAAGNIASPDFDALTLRELLEGVWLSQLPEEGSLADAIRRILDLVDVALAPEGGQGPQIQALFTCIDRHDPEAALAGALYDFFRLDRDQLPARLESLGQLAEEPAGGALAQLWLGFVGVVERAPRSARDACGLAARFLTPARARVLLPTLHRLRGTGVASELGGLPRRLLQGCASSEEP